MTRGDDGSMAAVFVTDPCLLCGRRSKVGLTEWEATMVLPWLMGVMKVQEAFPEWSADKRELLITGTHPACWEAMCGEEDGDDG